MSEPGLGQHFFSADESRRRRRFGHPEMSMNVSGVGEAQGWAETWSRPPSPRRSRWEPVEAEAEAPGMPPPGWGPPGLGPPFPSGRGFPYREGRGGVWIPPERQGGPPQDPRWREWGCTSGDDDGLNSSHMEGPWDRPDPERWGGPPSRDARWECAGGSSLGGLPGSADWDHSSSGKGRGRWSSSPQWGRQEDPGSWNQDLAEPFLENLGRSRQDSPERWRGEHQSLGREMRSWGSPEKRQLSPSHEKRSWGHRQREPRGQHSGGRGQPVREPFQADSARNEGRWRGMEKRGEESLNPPARAKRQKSPTGDHRSWSNPELECSGSTGSRNQPIWEQNKSNPGGGERDIRKRRGGKHPSANLGKREWGSTEIVNKRSSSDGVQQDGGGSARSGGGASPDESQEVDTGTCEQEKQEECSDAGEGSLERSGSPPPPSISPTTPKQWTPREQVVSWWMRCQSILKNKVRQQFLAICPRPTLPDGTSETPCLNAGIMNVLDKQQMKELVTGPRTLWQVQEEVLDMLAPAFTIYEMAEEAMEKGEQVDPVELREWARQLVRYVGSINHRLTLQRRWHVLHVLNPRLNSLSSKLIGQSTNGMLFAEDKARLLQEIIKRFPQLTRFKVKPPPPRKKVPFKGKAAYRWAPLESRYQPKSRGSKSSRPSTVNRQAEQNHR